MQSGSSLSLEGDQGYLTDTVTDLNSHRVVGLPVQPGFLLKVPVKSGNAVRNAEPGPCALNGS